MFLLLQYTLLSLTLLVPASHAQFTCSFAGTKNAADCTAMTDDGAAHCVWCTIGGSAVQDFGFCVSEVQAEAMEANIPALHCDRYSGGSDDAVPSDDRASDDDGPVPSDDAPVDTDDTAPATDDKAADDDHAGPDDFWTCLQQPDRKACAAASCTWCDTQGGFGLCMTGPTAESASHSAWFTCHNRTTTTEDVLDVVPLRVPDTSCLISSSADECRSTRDATGTSCAWCNLLDLTTLCLSTEQAAMGRSLGISCEATVSARDDPYDPSCALAYVLDPSHDACVAAVDEDNAPCQFCTLSGFDLCLTAEQAAMGQQLGIACDSTVAQQAAPQDPYDPSCAIAFLEDPTKEACVAAVDADNAPCEFCSLPGVADLCLTPEQAAMGQQLGITCDAAALIKPFLQDDPYDPSCLLAYLQDASKEACLAAVDEDNLPCEFCSLQGALDLCLTVEQAQMGEQLGITCDEQTALLQDDDPYDPSCLLAYVEEATRDACVAAVDADGHACEFCSFPGVLDVCLTAEQVAMGQPFGITCDAQKQEKVLPVASPYDPSCMAAYWTDQSEQECRATTDQSGAQCHYCALPGSFVACLTTEQAEIGKQLGMDCGSDYKAVAFPDDFFTCLQQYEEGDCRNASCTWCNTQVGLGFCLAPAAAESTKQCTFFDCQFDDNAAANKVVTDIYDPVCLAAGLSADDAAEVCGTTNGTDGTPCVWCDAAGVFGLCLSSEQAAAAGTYLQCNAAATA